MLINGRKNVGIENSNLKKFIDYSPVTDDVYEDLEDYNPTKKRRVLIVFHDMIADMESNKKLNPIATQNCFKEEENLTFHLFLYHNLVSNCIRLNAT